MHLIIYGSEGSGKGTQAKLISEGLQIPLYTSGDLVREAAKGRDDSLGKTCFAALAEGRYVSDEVMFKLWEDKLGKTEAKTGFILDGFPRNLNQAQFLYRILDKYGYGIDIVIYLTIPDEEAVKRLVKRKRMLFEGSKIPHDTPERIVARLKSYHEAEKPLTEFFYKKGILAKIDGTGNIEEVSKRIQEKINATL